jgi:transketolase
MIERLGHRRGVDAAFDAIGVKTFGAAAPGEFLLCEYGLTADNVGMSAGALLY